ncbi:hypothetical protein SCHPADRAFT_908035 [Schizopora paradoxa]|uniref:Uncharacterized protein n=1 Tax=Schizopora paradoxa TaxID=27342 RepID=A0A0H2RWE2_9AGAM|nr:hypothetical protein SCHPADRAFT_908035 [Schizopora paradoxa]
MNANIILNIPPEILDRIFRHCERFRKDRSRPTLVPNSRLRLLLLVCRKWHGIAERRLYSSVSIGSDVAVKDKNRERRDIFGKDVCRRFCEMVENNTRIASLVRELCLGCEHIHPEESEMHIRIIRACTNVESIELNGCDGALLDDLKAVLAKSNLISLSLSGAPLRDYGSYAITEESGPIFSLSETLSLLPSWPRLQAISVTSGDARDVNGYEDIEHRLALEELRHACPTLRRISIGDSVFNSKDLQFLSHVAPNLEDIYMFIWPKCTDILRKCLETWCSSLKHLWVNTYGLSYSVAVPPNFSPVLIPSMVKLRELRSLNTSAPLFTASALLRLPKLEKLTFTRGTHSQCVELAQLIGKGKIPCLRELRIALFEFDTDNEQETRNQRELEVCAGLRRVCETRKIIFRDSFASVELEEHYGYDEEMRSEASEDD